METFTVSFFGHRQMENSGPVEERLKQVIRDLLLTKEYVEFLVGCDGDFDRLVASAVRECKTAIRDDNSALILVLPYVTARYQNNREFFRSFYDEVELCDASGRGYFKAAHQVRNRAMVDRSDLVVCYVERDYGGACQTMEYATKREVACINLAAPLG